MLHEYHSNEKFSKSFNQKRYFRYKFCAISYAMKTWDGTQNFKQNIDVIWRRAKGSDVSEN